MPVPAGRRDGGGALKPFPKSLGGCGKNSVVVILSEAKNLSSIYPQSTERFFGEKNASE
jgi:hypothetical protein